jgi:hypothetical protein
MHLTKPQTTPKFTFCIGHGFAQFPRKYIAHRVQVF